jgi:hypothetical protein
MAITSDVAGTVMNLVPTEQPSLRGIMTRVLDAIFSMFTGTVGSDVSIRIFAMSNVLLGALATSMTLALVGARKFGPFLIPSSAGKAY